jgi:hypothetical protein
LWEFVYCGQFCINNECILLSDVVRSVIGFVGTDHLRTNIIINDEILQVIQFTYLYCSISYQCSNDVELKLATFLQLIDTVNRTIFKEVS